MIDEVGKQKPLTAKTDPMLSCGDREEARVKFVRLRTQRSTSGSLLSVRFSATKGIQELPQLL
jgi:hypothetical protein